MSQQRKSCRDITFRIHNKEQQNLFRDKDYFCHDKESIREVNLCHDKKLKSNMRGMAAKKFMLQHSKELKAKSLSRQRSFSIATIKAME